MVLSVDQSELSIDRELVVKAGTLGIKATLPSISDYQCNTSSASSQSTESTSQDHVFSAASDGTNSAYLTPHSSIFGPPSPDPAGSDSAPKPARNYNFTPYEKYLAQNTSPFDDGRRKSSVGDSSGQSIFSCLTRVCTICKADAHPVGTDCPEDQEVQNAPKVGSNPGVRRCYKCRALVERAADSSDLTCLCGAQFCADCGGVWDAATGCPNICDGKGLNGDFIDGEVSEGLSGSEAKEEAVVRSSQHPSVQSLLQDQGRELQRFLDFHERTKDVMNARQSEREAILGDQQTAQEAQMKDAQAKATAHLEDQQIADEMELRATLDQSQRTINMRIKHMEAYCDGMGQNPTESNMPPRVVTEQNLRDLGRQYNIREDMERQHTAKINMMRDRQAKRMEDLIERQEEELEKLACSQLEEQDALLKDFAREREAVGSVFETRQARLTARWTLSIRVLCKELEAVNSVTYSPLPPPSWPSMDMANDDSAQEVPTACDA
ncbi:IBR domain-containing protein [Purpureocillium lavendulum]|uniref:IBR domain-containing protein n=1 Tax=Purpureocillium lavendulum TaxID=1247861 RepID=A0AB34FZ87_9HYPO|nr:IBR domain-containing protein [Purpureocillium lavendulum]